MAFNKELMTPRLAALAAEGIYLGTSSWKYPGWFGQLYTAARYEYRGKVADSRFQRGALEEYAEVFHTVGVDSTYYSFPGEKFLTEMASQVPDNFKFGFKVTDAVTVKSFPNHPRHGANAGKANPFFLNADVFTERFLGPCENIRPKVGVLMFEFSRFWPSDYAHGRDFIADLDAFLGKLPKGWPYAIEFRNRNWLRDEYFACLAKHSVTHVFNSWEAMPSIEEQMALPGSETNSDLVAARFLLKPGRAYNEAVDAFSPYNETKEVYEEARKAGAELIRKRKNRPRQLTLIFVNNRLEGNALNSIAAMTDYVDG